MLDQVQVKTLLDALSASPMSSYAIGPLDPMQFTPLHTHLSTGEEYSLLVPVQLPPSILTHPIFKDGYEWAYTEGNPEEEWTVPKLVNEVYHFIAELCYEDEPDFCAWMLEKGARHHATSRTACRINPTEI